ncbi:MAG: hypothetical protein ACRCT1_02045 [Microcoleaceae cyanobacterium]
MTNHIITYFIIFGTNSMEINNPQSPIPSPQSPVPNPNPQSPVPNPQSPF